MWRPETAPSTAELLWRASVNNAARPMHAGRVMARTVPQLGRLQRQIQRRSITPPPTTIPRTRWSGPVTAHRVFDAIRLQLDDLRAVKEAVPGATINDVVLTTVGGGLRDYLLAKDELPDDPLIAMAPISVRSDAERGAAGNMVSGMFTTLGTDIADPFDRLAAVREGTHQSKEFANALGARTLLDMADLMPGGLVGLGARTSARLSLANRLRPVFNTTVTNMPGPRHPLYMAGAQLVAMYGAGMITEGMGLIHPVMSYCGDITISFTSCREMLPDPAVYADCLRTSFDELNAATSRRGRRARRVRGGPELRPRRPSSEVVRSVRRARAMTSLSTAVAARDLVCGQVVPDGCRLPHAHPPGCRRPDVCPVAVRWPPSSSPRSVSSPTSVAASGRWGGRRRRQPGRRRRRRRAVRPVARTHFGSVRPWAQEPEEVPAASSRSRR